MNRPRLNAEKVMELPVSKANYKEFEDSCKDEYLTYRFIRDDESFKIYEVTYLRDWELFYLGRRYGHYVDHANKVYNNRIVYEKRTTNN